MALQRSSTDPALWEAPDADTRAGTWAVVIGVSRYEHLPDPNGPPRQPPPPDNAYGLGQLNVSALTAFRFFRWLREGYHFESAPVSRCWVLLSPTDAEVAQEPELAQAAADGRPYPPATLAECQRVLEAWIVSMQGVHPEYLGTSRAMFFFSGHGINSGDRQLLLPADWLRPPLFNVNAALSAQNVMSGLRSLPLPEEFLFLDACRSRPVQLAALQLTGTPVLPDVPQSSVDPSRVSPLMWASAAGTEAWQPSTPAEGPSLFGQALLEGLGGRVPGDPGCGHPPGHIGLYGLGQFVNKRVSDLLKQHGSTVPRPIRIGESSDVCITLPAPAPAEADPASEPSVAPPPRPQREGRGGEGSGSSSGVWRDDEPGGGRMGGLGPILGGVIGGIDGITNRIRQDADDVEEALEEMAGTDGAPAADEPESAGEPESAEAEDAGDWMQLPPEGVRPQRESVGALHHTFGSEHLSDMWHHARVVPLGGGPEAEVVVHRVWLAEHSLWNVVFSLQGGNGPHWLDLSDHASTYGITLPGDFELQPRYTLYFAKDPVDHTFRRVEAGLSTDSRGMLKQMAELWDKYSDLRLREVISELDARVFEEALRSKMQSPLAAEIAGLFLLRGRQYEKLHDWLGNLASWHPQRTDGPVLWAEHLRQARESKDVPKDQVEQLLRVAERGLPHTAEAVVYLAGQMDEVLRFADLAAPDRQTLERLRERVSLAVGHLRTGGLFAVYAGARGSLSPELVRPLG